MNFISTKTIGLATLKINRLIILRPTKIKVKRKKNSEESLPKVTKLSDIRRSTNRRNFQKSRDESN
jgi:hypothetical protein